MSSIAYVFGFFALSSIGITGCLLLLQYDAEGTVSRRVAWLQRAFARHDRLPFVAAQLTRSPWTRSPWIQLIIGAILFAAITGFISCFLAALALAGYPQFLGLAAQKDFERLEPTLIWFSTVVAYAFIPAYFCGLFRLYSASLTGNLASRTFFEATVGVVLSCLGAVIVWQLVSVIAPRLMWSSAAPLLPQRIVLTSSLVIGFMPIISFLRPFFGQHPGQSLMLIDGMGLIDVTKLAGLGITSVQNLASANPLYILQRTGYEPLRIIDWIAQAQLSVRFTADTTKLRELRVRTILDLAELLDRPSASDPNIISGSLTDSEYLRLLSRDSSFKALTAFRHTIEVTTDSQYAVLCNNCGHYNPPRACRL